MQNREKQPENLKRKKKERKKRKEKGKDDGNEPTNQFTATTAFFFIPIFGYFMDLR